MAAGRAQGHPDQPVAGRSCQPHQGVRQPPAPKPHQPRFLLSSSDCHQLANVFAMHSLRDALPDPMCLEATLAPPTISWSHHSS
jgi:hypothetical protein